MKADNILKLKNKLLEAIELLNDIESSTEEVDGTPFGYLSIDDLNPVYSFEHFEVNDKNKNAYESFMRLATKQFSSKVIFLHGKSNSGKTHLLISLYRHIVQDEKSTIIYVPMRQYFSEFITSIRNRTDHFEKKYAMYDYVLFDDFDYLESKVETQNEFCYYFDRLYNYGRTIIIAGVKHPHKLEKISDQLLGRITRGYVVEL